MQSIQIEKVVALDPVLEVSDMAGSREVIARGGVNKSVFRMEADSYSEQSIIFNNITPPSLTTVVQRVLRLNYKLSVTCSYTTVGAALPNYPLFPAVTAAGVVYDAPGAPTCVLRSFPLASASSSYEVRINGSATSVSPMDYICMFPHILTNDEQNRFCSEFPCQKDNLSLYLAPVAITDFRSPFVNYGTNTTVPARGSFLGTLSSSTAVGPLTVDVYSFDITE